MINEKRLCYGFQADRPGKKNIRVRRRGRYGIDQRGFQKPVS